MTNYRRDFTKGACYFFTINLAQRDKTHLVENIELLRVSFKTVIKKRPFTINAITILPDHLHMVMTLPNGDNDYSTRIRLIKTYFSKQLKHFSNNKSNQLKSEKGIWQRRFWEHKIRDQQDYQNHIHYCYINPVKHELVKSVKDWPYSSFHRDVKLGLFPIDWAGTAEESSKFSFGESPFNF